MENFTSPTPDFSQNFQNPQNSPTPPSSRKKWIFIAVLILAIVGGTVYFLGIGGGNFLQGKISRVKTPDQSVDTRSKTTQKTPETKDKNSSTTAPVVKEPPKEPPKETSKGPQSPIFDEKTVSLSYGVVPTVKDSDKFLKFNTGETVGVIGEYNLNLPKYLPENMDKENSYTQLLIFEVCKDNLSKCLELKKDTQKINKYSSNSIYPVKFTKNILEKIVKELEIKHNDTIQFRYRITDPTGIEFKSNVITVKMLDDKAPPEIPKGQILNQEVFTTHYNPDNNYQITESNTKLSFDILLKEPIEFFVNLPTYDVNAFSGLKDQYSMPFNLKACNKDLGDCKEVFKGSEITIWSKQKKKYYLNNYNH